METTGTGLREIRPQDPEIMQELMDTAKRLSGISQKINCSIFCLGFRDGTYGVDVRFNRRGFIGRKRPESDNPLYEMTSSSIKEPMGIDLKDINFEDLRDTPISANDQKPAADSPHEYRRTRQ